MSNHTTEMIKVPIKINGNFHFLKFGMVKLLKSLHNAVDIKMYYLR